MGDQSILKSDALFRGEMKIPALQSDSSHQRDDVSPAVQEQVSLVFTRRRVEADVPLCGCGFSIRAFGERVLDGGTLVFSKVS